MKIQVRYLLITLTLNSLALGYDRPRADRDEGDRFNLNSAKQVRMYQCPQINGGALGGGQWGFYGCQGQLTNKNSCLVIEYPGSRSYNCEYVGKIALTP